MAVIYMAIPVCIFFVLIIVLLLFWRRLKRAAILEREQFEMEEALLGYE
jgi:preprotein translocase subunit SecG